MDHKRISGRPIAAVFLTTTSCSKIKSSQVQTLGKEHDTTQGPYNCLHNTSLHANTPNWLRLAEGSNLNIPFVCLVRFCEIDYHTLCAALTSERKHICCCVITTERGWLLLNNRQSACWIKTTQSTQKNNITQHNIIICMYNMYVQHICMCLDSLWVGCRLRS